MEGVRGPNFQNQSRVLKFGSLNFSDHLGDLVGSLNFSDHLGDLDVPSNKKAEVLNQQAENLATKDSTKGNGNFEGGRVESEEHSKKYYYPLRPEAEICFSFMTYGWCKFGGNCRYNHAFNRRSQADFKDITKLNYEETSNTMAQVECKYNLTPEGCKYGKACRYNHSGRTTEKAPDLEFNFLGLPIRPEENECPQYRRNGSCTYGSKCWFDHPEPSSMGEGFSLSGFVQPEEYMYQPAQCPPYFEWTGYQVPLENHEAPIYTTSGESLSTPPPVSVKTPASDVKSSQQQQQHPEPIRQPETSFKSGSGVHHTKTFVCPVNDNGLPLRPDKEVCAFYNWYRVCKHGPGCKFDHPVPRAEPAPAADQSKEAQFPQLPHPTNEDNN